ncbi:GNAT family N-acetyltransferase [Micromonospora sp. DT233]|uniref:GNAT family N-acetyltransferase n=1 Tax=Micromonospora sp. DT233 TaxID=3393432 RepID=UPI003CEFCEA9
MPNVRLEPMTEDQYTRYRETAEADYAQSIFTSGLLPLREAQEKAAADYRRLLPEGLRTRGHHFWTVYDDGLDVGLLWLHTEQKSDGPHAFIYDVEVRKELRRSGYGRAILQAVDRWCREAGVLTVGLNVFGQNTGARALYEGMGYEITAVQMRKRL